MEKILFGDNQFFGVNHMSEEKARAQAIRFQDLSAIINVLNEAYDAGIHVFMCTTHDRISQICDHVRANSARYEKLQFYPCMPYAHKYANAVTEYGALEAFRRFLPDEGSLLALLKGGVSMARRDVEGAARLLIDAEMKMFRGLSTPVIFMQNILTDLLLGIGFLEAFVIFERHVRERYNAEAGFITMNMPVLLDALEKVGMQNPIICANINKAGFRMSGGKESYEYALENRQFRAIAMSVFASGAIPPEEAIRYVCEQRRLASIVFGASSAANIRHTKSLIDKYSQVI